MMILMMLMAGQADAAIQAEAWAKKAEPIADCVDAADCDAKWSRAAAWIKANTRFQLAVDKPDLLATYGAIYANVDLSYVLVKRPRPNGGFQIAARAWCGNVISCKPKPKNAIASLKREIQSLSTPD